MPEHHWPSEKELAAQLKKLVAFGLTVDKLSKSAKILNLPNIRARAGMEASQRELAYAAEALIKDAVRTFGDTPEATGFRLLLVLDPRSSSYSASRRREETIKVIGERVRIDTWRTEDKWELAYLEKLARRIMDLPPEGLGDGYRTPIVPSDSRALKLPAVSMQEIAGETRDAIKAEFGDDPRDDYEQLYAKMTLRFLAGRIPAYAESERILRARTSQEGAWWEGFRYTASNDCVEIVPLDETASVVRVVPGSFHDFRYYELRFPARLEPGDIHKLRVRKIITDRRREPRPFFLHMARRSYLRLIVRVEFAPDSLPAEVWRIVTPTIRAPKNPIAAQHVLPSATGVVESPFRELIEGISYGFSWRW